MNSAVPFLVGVVLVVWAAVFALSFLPSYRLGRARRFSRSVGLDLPASLEPGVAARLAVRLRGASVGAAVSTLAMLLLTANGVPVRHDSDFATFVIVGGAFVGVAIGAGLASLVRVSGAADDRVRVARAQAVELSDYVAPFELLGARFGVGLAAIVAIVGVVLASSPGLIWLAVVLTVFAVVALVLFELVARRILRRGQPVGTPPELVWDDALRASLLRDIITAPLALSAYGLFIAVVGISDGVASTLGGRGGLVAQTAIIGVLLLAAVASVVYSLASRPQRHFLRRLWPELRSDARPAGTPAADAA